MIPQPLGVVGVIVPWNFPLLLSLSPLTGILAAGNRAMVKMSENSGRLADLLIQISPKYFPEDKLAFFDGSGGRGSAFSSLPFDHLLFTGSGATGRAVMANAARNLTPVTLELGGKSPAIVAPDFPIKTAAERIMWSKTFNAGQVCLAVDHVFLPRGAEGEFVAQCKRLFAKRYPDINGPDFTSIIDQRSYDRLNAALEDAREKGATLINLAEGQTPDKSKRKFPPHLALNPTGEMEIMRREIFGPILPILVYDQPQEVVDAVNAGDRPLALYPFTNKAETRDFYIARIMSGGVSVNDTDAAYRPARFAFRRRRRERHGPLSWARGVRHLFEAAARLPAGTDIVCSDDVSAALWRLVAPAPRFPDEAEELTNPAIILRARLPTRSRS